MIPEDWDVRKLKSLVRSHNSGIYKSQAIYGHGYNIAGVSDIYGIEKVDGQFFANVPLSPQERAKHSLHCNDLLYGESSLVREGIARTVYVTEQGAGTAFAWHTRRYSIDQRTLLSSYLYYYLQTTPARAHMISNSIQTAITGINTVAYFACPTIVPPIAEQEAIAEALSDADALIESLEKLLTKKRQIKQGAMQELLTGKKRLPGFNGEWEVKRLGEISAIAIGRTPSRRNTAFWGRGHVWLSIADLHSKVVKESQEKITDLAAAGMSCVPKGTLLMSFKLSIGRLCFAGCDLFTNEAICSFTNLKANADYLYYALCRTDFSLYGKQAVKGHTLNSESLKVVEVSLPEPPEQTAIATILSDMDAEITALEAKLSKARQIKRGMMQELLTGRIRLI